MTTETTNRGIVSAAFARDFAEVMTAWHTLRTMVREQFPAASEEELFQISSKLMKKTVRLAARLEARVSSVVSPHAIEAAKPRSVVSHHAVSRQSSAVSRLSVDAKPHKRKAKTIPLHRARNS
jgi:hypothetical protein